MATGGSRTPTLLVWATRALWAVAALACGPVFAAALDGRSAPVQAVASVALWAAWAVVLCASLVLHPVGLTALRLATSSAVAGIAVCWFAGGPSGAAVAVGVLVSVAAMLLAFLPEVGGELVNGPAYPNERRFLLRAPGPLLAGPLVLAWLASVGLPVGALLLLAARQWVAGAVGGVVGAVAAVVLVRAMHGLSRRWVVFVPAGVVLHDPMTLADPVLFVREEIVSLAPAVEGTGALDLTAKAFGLAVELEVASPTPLALMRVGARVATMVEASALLFTPTRPGAVLARARDLRLR
jgi:hypothetical protein